MSIFGITKPKFRVAAEEIEISYARLIVNEPAFRTITHESIINRHREWIDKAEHWNLTVYVHLYKYATELNPDGARQKYLELLSFEGEDVDELWPHSDGVSFKDGNGDAAAFRFLKMTARFINTDKYPDILILEFKSKVPLEFFASGGNGSVGVAWNLHFDPNGFFVGGTLAEISNSETSNVVITNNIDDVFGFVGVSLDGGSTYESILAPMGGTVIYANRPDGLNVTLVLLEDVSADVNGDEVKTEGIPSLELIVLDESPFQIILSNEDAHALTVFNDWDGTGHEEATLQIHNTPNVVATPEYGEAGFESSVEVIFDEAITPADIYINFSIVDEV